MIVCPEFIASRTRSRAAVAGFVVLLAFASFAQQPPTPLRPPAAPAAPAPRLNVGPPAMPEALALVMQITDKLRQYVLTSELASVHNQDMALNMALTGLLKDSEKIATERREQFKVEVVQLARKVSKLHTAADANDQAAAQGQLAVVQDAFTQLKKHFPQEILKTATLLADPNCNPATAGRTNGLAALHLAATATQPTIRATVQMTAPLTQGEPNQAILKLTRTNGAPLLAGELQEVHQARIHLLVIEPSLTDYHHVHPQPTAVPGEYAFAFTPRQTGAYRIWADIRPAPMNLQEYALADLPGLGPASGLNDRASTARGRVDGFEYELTFNTPVIKAGVVALGRLRVTGPDGRGFEHLESLMGAYAHLVGFHEDYQTVLHLHPRGAPAPGSNARGGPELEFQLFAIKPGFYRLFAQVQIGGISRFAPFGIQVVP